MFRFVIELKQKMALFYKFRASAKSFSALRKQVSYFSARCLSSNSPGSDGDMPPVPERIVRHNETLEVRKARLLYQSRKRGMLENGLLLSTFAAKYLNNMSEAQTIEYDNLINKPSNDWEIYYWAIGNKPTPAEFDGEVMNLLKEHAQNNDQDSRIRQPDL